MSTISRKLGEAQSNSAAIILICLGVFCLVVNDAIAKWLIADYNPLQIVFMRYSLALPMIAGAVFVMSGKKAFHSHHVRIHAMRGLFLLGGAFSFFLSLKYLPLAEATALIFVAPIFITALSVPILGEHVGWRRWSAVIAGFIGVLIIIQPGGAAFQPASLIVLVTAMLYALIMISARFIRSSENVWTMMFYMALFPALFSGLLVPLVWRTPEWEHMPLFAGIAFFGATGMTLISQAFRRAPAAVVAPFDYTALVWASLLGWLIWNEIPTAWTYAGAAVIIASGIYIVLRETRRRTPASDHFV